MAGSKPPRTSGRPGRGQDSAVNGAGGVTSKNGGASRGGASGGGTTRAGSGRPDRAGGAGARGPAQARTGKPAQTRKARDRARTRELAEQTASAAPVQVGPPLWVQLTTFALALCGLGVSIYMTIEHFTGNTTLACSATGTFNCEAVTTSPESMVFGVLPVAVLGLAFYVFMVAVTTPWAWRSSRREIAWARLGSVVLGVGFILYLIYAEFFQVRFICLWCTSVHVITFLLFVVVVLAAAFWGLVPTDARRAR